MRQSSITSSYNLAEDGHPCEAALEYRRIAIRNNIVEDISIDGLDLAISFAWIGKAISKTKKIDAWTQTNIDPNTWEIIRALSLDTEIRRYAINDALHAEAQPIFSQSLNHLRISSAFHSAVAKTQATIALETPRQDLLFWLGELQHIAKNIKGPEIIINIAKSNNLISLDTFKKNKKS